MNSNYNIMTYKGLHTFAVPHRVSKKSGAARGFVALMSILIISAILLTLVYTLNASSFFARLDALGAENKRTSLGLAEACVNSAMLKVAQGTTPSNLCVSLGGTCGGTDPQKVCKICSSSVSGGIATVRTRARYNGTFTNLEVKFTTTPSNFVVTSWKENETGDPSCTLP